MASGNTHSALPSCPICFGTLSSPIRMLSCGHNFCHDCLQELWVSQSNSCPICREEFELGVTGVEGIPRNWEVEKLIDQLNSIYEGEEPSTKDQNVLAGEALSQLKALSSSYIAESKFHEAIKVLDAILIQVEGCDKIRPNVDKVQCLLELDNINDAIQLIQFTVSIIASSEFLYERRNHSEDYYGLILKLIEFCPLDQHKTATDLLHCLLSLAQSLKKKEKLKKLGIIGQIMKRIAGNLSRKKKYSQIKEQYTLLEAVRKEFYKLNDVNIKVKAEEIAFFLDCFGRVCYEAKAFYKAISLYKEAITITNFFISEETRRSKILGMVFHNMGCAMKEANQFNEAKSALTNAIKAYETSAEYSEEEKTMCICRCVKVLGEVEEKLSTPLYVKVAKSSFHAALSLTAHYFVTFSWCALILIAEVYNLFRFLFQRCFKLIFRR